MAEMLVRLPSASAAIIQADGASALSTIDPRHFDLTTRAGLPRDDHDRSSRCQWPGRNHAESAAGVSSRTRERKDDNARGGIATRSLRFFPAQSLLSRIPPFPRRHDHLLHAVGPNDGGRRPSVGIMGTTLSRGDYLSYVFLMADAVGRRFRRFIAAPA